MDNKHYFRLYLIRIKHDLVLFALLLTAIQSLIYLILALVSEKVRSIWVISVFCQSSVSFQYNLSQFILEIILFSLTMLLSLLLMVLLQREKFFHKHLHLSCFAIWLLLTFFSTIPILLQQYPSLLRFIGLITFTLITIHTTLPIERSWTMLMALITSIIDCIFVLYSHDLRYATNKSHRMEFKLEVRDEEMMPSIKASSTSIYFCFDR